MNPGNAGGLGSFTRFRDIADLLYTDFKSEFS